MFVAGSVNQRITQQMCRHNKRKGQPKDMPDNQPYKQLCKLSCKQSDNQPCYSISNTYYNILSVNCNSHDNIISGRYDKSDSRNYASEGRADKNITDEAYASDVPAAWMAGYLFLSFRSAALIHQNGGMINILPGTCLISAPGAFLRVESPDSALDYSWIRFIPDHPEVFTQLGLPVNQVFMPLKTDFIDPALKEAESGLSAGDMHCAQYISSITAILFIRLSREMARSQPNIPDSYLSGLRENFRQFRIRMYRNPEHDWTADNMSAEVSLKTSRFIALYGDFFGITPKQDLILARISRAKRLLENSGAKISLIAELAGYTSIYHFIRQFGSVESMPPGEYRRKYCKGR